MIENVAKYLNVDEKQFAVLDQLVNKAAAEGRSPESLASPDLLQSTGMEQKFSNAGFDMASVKSLFGFLGPVLLGSLAGGALGKTTGSGALGGLGGALLGGLLQGRTNTGGMGLPSGMGGGLGSLISGLNTSRNNQSLKGLLGKLLG